MILMKIHITRPVPQEAVDFLESRGHDVTSPQEHGLPSRSSLLSAVRDVDAILSILTERIDAEVMDCSPNLKVISNMAVGYDNIDVVEANLRGIAVCNTPGVLTETSADFAWALLMATARRLVECHKFVEQGKFEWWGPQLMLGADVHSKTLGIIGFGKIGRAMARRAQGFGMQILYSGETAPERSEMGRKVDFDYLLKRSDFVSLHVPYRESTHHLIGKREFKLMRPNSYLVNTSRGAVVNEAELVEALQAQDIAGAGLDVFEEEPRVHPALLSMPNVVLAPHAASASVETRERMAMMAAQNLLACLNGERPHSIVNPEVL